MFKSMGAVRWTTRNVTCGGVVPPKARAKIVVAMPSCFCKTEKFQAVV